MKCGFIQSKADPFCCRVESLVLSGALTFMSVEGILKCDHSSECNMYWAALSFGTINFVTWCTKCF